MFKLDSPINLDCTAFLRWWGEELKAMLPERLRALLLPQRAQLVLRRQADGLEIRLIRGGCTCLVERLALEGETESTHPALKQMQAELAEADVCLNLTDDQCLVRTFKLPAVAAENLKQVVGFEMDRLSPFKADQVYFTAQILERLPQTRQIRVEMVAAPREKLDALLAELAALGFQPERVVAEGAHLSHDLLPAAFRRPRPRWPTIANGLAMALFCALLLAVLVFPLWLDHRYEDELRRELRQVTKVAKEVEALKAEAERLADENGFLQRKKDEEPAMVEMLDELSRVIPDQTWLSGLQYRERKVTIQGQSPAASSLIAQIEASPRFKNTSFVSPVTKDIASGLERFQIASEVLGRRTSERPPNAQ